MIIFDYIPSYSAKKIVHKGEKEPLVRQEAESDLLAYNRGLFH